MTTQPKTILVTGATGTLGYNFVRLLISRSSHIIHAPVRNPSPALFALGSRVNTIQIGLSDAAGVKALVKGLQPDVIVHCAASGLRPPRESWFRLIHFNVEATLRLFEAAADLDRDIHFIHISSGLAYREQQRNLVESDPLDTLHPYGASKAAADALLRAAASEFGRRLTIFRPFAFTGVHDAGTRLFPGIIQAAAANVPIPLTPGGQIRDFCPVEDIAEAILLAVERESQDRTEVFNVGSGVAATLRDLVREVCSELELNVELEFGARPYRLYEPMHLVADIDHAKCNLGWKPRIRLAYAVWELASELHPELRLRRPAREI
jgi:UDP-glucose 4-epimerase